VRIAAGVEGATIRLDGEAVGTGTVELELPPGPHEIEIEAPGHVPFERSVEVRPGERSEVEATLAPIAAGEDLASSPVLWGVVGGSVVAVGALVVGLVIAFPSTEAPYGGSTNVVLQPLTAPLVAF
jgi:hypothetical protein